MASIDTLSEDGLKDVIRKVMSSEITIEIINIQSMNNVVGSIFTLTTILSYDTGRI